MGTAGTRFSKGDEMKSCVLWKVTESLSTAYPLASRTLEMAMRMLSWVIPLIRGRLSLP